MFAGRIVKESTDVSRFTVDLTEARSLFATFLNGEGGAAPWLSTEQAVSFATPTVALGQGTWATVQPPTIPPADPVPLTVTTSALVNGGQALQLYVSAGTPGNTYTITTVVRDNASRFLTVDIGVTISGQLVITPPLVPGPPTGALSTSGGTMTGPLILFRDPVLATEAATKRYADDLLANGITTNQTFIVTAGGAQITGTSKITGTLETTGALTVDAGGLTVTTGGAAITGTSKITGTLETTGALTVDAGGLTVTTGGAAITGTSKITGTLETTGALTVDAGGLTVTTGGAAITGTSKITGTLETTGALTVDAGGLTVTTGGLTVTTGGAAITGTSKITGTLETTGALTVDAGGLTVTTGGLTVAAGGAAITGNSKITGTLETTGALAVDSGGLTVSSGGAAITGNATFAGGAINMSPANNSVTIAPTGTGTVTIGPTTAGTLDRMTIGSSFPAPSIRAGTGLNLSNSNGIIIGESGSSGTPGGYFFNEANAVGAVTMLVRNDRTDGTAIGFLFGAGSTIGSIVNDGSVIHYNTTSDYRLKVTFGVADFGAVIDAVPVYDAEMKYGDRRPMFLAHELQAQAPWAVTGAKDAVDAEGNAVYQQVDHAALIPAMWAELQSLRKRVAELESRK